jgi:general secretion pathway protein K
VAAGLAVLERSALANADTSNGTTAAAMHDSLDQPWAMPLPPIPLDGGYVTLSIVDEDSKIGVNQLYDFRNRRVDPVWSPIIERLLANIGVSIDLLPVLEDWIDPDSVETQGGAESDYYLHLAPPYEPRNNLIPTIYDLRMLKGMDDATFIKLTHFFTALPLKQVNVNTASAEVLAALTPELENSPEEVKEILATREIEPFTDINKLFNEVHGLPQDPKFKALLNVSSSYFTITGEGDFAGARKRIYSTFKRVPMQPRGAGFILASWHED